MSPKVTESSDRRPAVRSGPSNKSYSVGPIAGRREVYDHNRHDAAFHGNRDSPVGSPPGPDPHRLFQQLA
jgi:hypothetical protein